MQPQRGCVTNWHVVRRWPQPWLGLEPFPRLLSQGSREVRQPWAEFRNRFAVDSRKLTVCFTPISSALPTQASPARPGELHKIRLPDSLRPRGRHRWRVGKQAKGSPVGPQQKSSRPCSLVLPAPRRVVWRLDTWLTLRAAGRRGTGKTVQFELP